MSKPELTYFDFSFWKAEVPRILFSMSKDGFEDKRLTPEQFQAMKTGGKFPFGSVPVLKVGDQELTQGVAIIRYAAAKANLIPKDLFTAAKMDEVLQLLEEFQPHISKGMPYVTEDETERLAIRKVLASDIIPKYFGRFEKLLGDRKYMAGDELSAADIAVWKMTHWLTCGILDTIPKTVGDNFKKLKAHFALIDAHPGVVAWKKKYPQTYN